MLYSNAARLGTAPVLSPPPPFRALVLDDSSFDRRRIKRGLINSGISVEVDEITCLYQLKPSLAARKYDLFICDYFLPDGTGEEALAVLLSDERNKSATPIVVSGNPWVNGGSVTALGKTIPFVDKSGLGNGEFFKVVVASWRMAQP